MKKTTPRGSSALAVEELPAPTPRPAPPPLLRQVMALVRPLANIGEAADRAALEMVRDAVLHLLRVHPVATTRVRDYRARRMGVAGRDSHAIPILDMARMVEISAWLVREDGWAPEAAAVDLRAFLVQEHGERGRGKAALPALDELADWLAHHVARARPTRGRVTTAGIVARVVHRRRLFGAGADEATTLKRVERLIKRHSSRHVE